MYDGSLYGQWEAIVTFQQMIVLCDAEGFIDMTPQAIAARTSIPLAIIQKGIELLEQPDQYSRTDGNEGRRIDRIDARRPWGWQVVNYLKYRLLASAEEKRAADRERIAGKREAARVSQDVAESRDLSQEVAKVAYAEAEAEAIKKSLKSRFDDFWMAYPRKIAKADAKRAWSRKRLDGKADEILSHLRERVGVDQQWASDGGKFIPYPATWLNDDGWLDEYTKAVEAKRHYL